MKKTEFSFADGFTSGMGLNDNPFKTFDWNKAAEIIKEKHKIHPDLIAEAGLQRDWDNTGGIIFENGKPTNENYTYLSSNWAIPTLILSSNGEEFEEIECYVEGETKYHSGSEWDEESLAILGL